jgi:hypothetical protein
MTDKWQTRPLVREGSPYGQDSNIQGRINRSWAPTDRLADCQSQCDSDANMSQHQLPLRLRRLHQELSQQHPTSVEPLYQQPTAQAP